MNTNRNVGCKESILRAETAGEVVELLDLVKTFKRAHPSTIRKCQRAAEKRVAQLAAETNQPKPQKKGSK